MDTQDMVNKANKIAIEKTLIFQVNGRDCTPKIISIDFLKEGVLSQRLNEETGQYELRPNLGMTVIYGDTGIEREFLDVISDVVLNEHRDILPSILFDRIASDWQWEGREGIMEKLTEKEG